MIALYWEPVPATVKLLIAIAVAVIGVARLGRLIVVDSFPPAVWARDAWHRLCKDGPWAELIDCWWCVTVYLAVACTAWGYFTSLHWSWWAFWGTLAVAYIAGIIIGRDEQRGVGGDE